MPKIYDTCADCMIEFTALSDYVKLGRSKMTIDDILNGIKPVLIIKTDINVPTQHEE